MKGTEHYIGECDKATKKSEPKMTKYLSFGANSEFDTQAHSVVVYRLSVATERRTVVRYCTAIAMQLSA